MLVSLSLIIIVAILLATLSEKVHLPRLVGFMLAGIILGPYVLNLIDPALMTIAPDIRQIALVIILLRAGLSLDMNDLKKVGRPAILLSFVPATLEIIGTVIFAPLFLGFSYLEAAILGAILAAVSPAVVVPRMLSMLKNKEGTSKSIPQMIMAGASMDDIYVIVLFTSFVAGAQGTSFSISTIASLFVSIFTGVGAGVLIGYLLAVVFKTFHQRDTIKVIILLAISMFLVGITPLINDYLPYSGLLSVIAIAMTWLAKAPQVSARLVTKYEKIWAFAEILLFVFVGAVVDIRLIGDVGLAALAVLAGGLVFRMIGVYLALLGTPLRFKERLFVAIAYLPKATVQASIGAIPMTLGIQGGQTMLIVAVLAILITAPLGAFLIDHTKHLLLVEQNNPVLH